MTLRCHKPSSDIHFADGWFILGTGSNNGSWLTWILIPISPFQNITLNNELKNKDIKFSIAYYYFPLSMIFYPK